MPKLPNKISIQEAANRLSVSTKTLRRWENKGLLVPKRTSGGHRRYNLSQLKNFERRSNSPSLTKNQLGGVHLLSSPQEKPSALDILKTALNKAPSLYSTLHLDQKRALKTYSRFAIIGLLITLSLNLPFSALAKHPIISLPLKTAISALNSFIPNNSNVADQSSPNTQSPTKGTVLASQTSIPTLNINVPSTFSQLVTLLDDITFEGTTADDNQTQITLTDPTTDNLINFPNASGEVSLLGQTIDLETEVSTTGTAGQLLIIDDSLAPTFTTLSGQATLNSSGTLTISDDIIDEANLDATNTASDNQILSYDSSSGGFTWVEDDTGTSSTTPWTITSNVTHLSASTDNLTVGSSTNLAKLAVDGDTDEIQLLIQGNTTQTSDLAVLEQSDGTDVLTISNSGAITLIDGGLLDLSAIVHDDSASQGLILPQAASLTSPSTGEGYLAWDTDDDTFQVFNGTSWSAVGGTPAGSDTQLQYNDGGSFGGTSSFTFNDSTLALSITDDLDLTFGADENFVIDAEATDSTGTAGVIDLDLDSTSSQQAINLDIETITDSATDTLIGLDILSTQTSTDNDAIYGIRLQNLAGTADAGSEYALYQTGTSWDLGALFADAVQLGENGADGQLVLYNELGVTDYTVTLNLSDSQAADITYTLPPNDGDTSQILSTNGSGTLTWIDVSAGAGGLWQRSGSELTPVNSGDTAAFGDLSLGLNDASATITSQDTNEDLTIDPNGSGDLYFHGSTYQISDTGDLTLGGRTTFENAEYIANETDDIIALVGASGTDDTDLYIDLDGVNPLIYSNTDSIVGIDDSINVTGQSDLEGYASIGNGSALDADETLIVDRDFTATAGNSAYGLHLLGNITENTSGTHTTIAPLAIDAITVTDGAGTEVVTNLASLYIAGAPTAGTTPTNGPYAIFADSGSVRFDGNTVLNTVTYTWPGSDASAANQVLASNSSGTLSWIDASAAANGHWTDGGTIVYLTDTTDDLAVGSSDSDSELFFDTSASALNLNPFGSSAGNTGEIRLQELEASGDNYTGFKPADTLAGNVIYTLPDADATSANQVLASNSSGTLSWIDVSAGSGSLWSQNSGVLSPSTGTDDLAIGGTDSTADFFVSDNGKLVFNASTTGTYVDFVLETEWTTGDLINADFASATTLTGDAVGLDLDLNTSVTGVADGDLTGVYTQTPALTSSGLTTTNYYGFRTGGGALDTTAAEGSASTVNWYGGYVQIPNIDTGEAGDTTNAYGLAIFPGTVTNGGGTENEYGILVDASTGDIVGGDASGDDLLLVSTTDATLGDIQFHTSTYTVNSTGDFAIGGRVTFENSEYISNESDDLLIFQGSGGTADTDIYFDLDDEGTLGLPVIYSNSDTAIGIDDNLTFVGAQTISTTTGNLTIDTAGTFDVDDATDFSSSVTWTGAVDIVIDADAATPIDIGADVFASGTLLDVAYDTAETLSGDTTGLSLNLNTNVTGVADGDLSVISLQTPSLTPSGANTTNYYGLNLTAAGALDTSDASATVVNWYGANLQAPNIDTGDAADTTTSYGLYLAAGTVTNGLGTENVYGIYIESGDIILDEDGGGAAGGSTGGDLILGEGQDLEIYHDGTNSNIVNNTGDLVTTSAADYSFTATGGQVEFASGTTLNIGGLADVAYNAISDSGTATTASTDDDLYIEDILEVDGTFDLDGAADFAGATTWTGAVDIVIDADAATPIDIGADVFASGTLLDIAYDTAETLTGDTVGQSINLNTNVTGVADGDLTVLQLQTPALTSSGTTTTNYYGQRISAAGALDTTVEAAQVTNVNWYGNYITAPNIDTGEAGDTTTSYGLYLAAGTVTAGAGTENVYGVYIESGDIILDEDGGGAAGGSTGGDLILGEGQDLEIYHDGTNSNIINNTGDLTADSVAGSLNLTSGENAADSIVISSDAGGIDITTASTEDIDISGTGGVNISSSEVAADALSLTASGGTTATLSLNSNGTGTAAIDINATGTGGDIDIDANDAITIDAGGAFSLDGAAASNVSVTGAQLQLSTITSGELDITGAGLVDLNAGANLDIDVTGTYTMDATTSFSIDGTGTASNVTLTSDGAADDFTVALAGAFDSSLILSSTGTGADALQVTASAGGIDITATGAAGEDIDIDATTSSLNLSGGEDVNDAITLLANGGTNSGIDLTATATTVDAVDFELSTTTGIGLDINVAAITTGTGLDLSNAANTLTSGILLNVNSTSTALTAATNAGSLINLEWEPATATTATGDLFRLNIGTSGNVDKIFNITDADSTVFAVEETKITSALPHEFTAAGDVSIAYDIQFTNQTSSFIKSYAPLTIEAGESHESNDLTLQTFNSGNVYLSPAHATVATTPFSFDAQETFTDSDATPDVSGGSHFITNTTAVTITDFDAGSGSLEAGHIIFVESAGAITYDVTSSGLNGGLADFVTAAGDMSYWIYDGADWNLINWMDDSDTQAGGADLAEWFVSSETLEPGDVVTIDPNESIKVKKSTSAYDTSTIGIVSTAPGITLGTQEINSYQVALAGRVPVKISTSSPNIQPGDYITASGDTGLGMKATSPGRVIGVAMQSWTTGQDSVEVFVNPTWHDPANYYLTQIGDINSRVDSLETTVATNSTAIANLEDITSSLTTNYLLLATSFETERLGIGTSAPATDSGRLIDSSSGAFLSTGGVWTNTSDENLKENFQVLDQAAILDGINKLNITQWNYKTESSLTRHIGPTAQDFYTTFGLGGSDTSISTIDPAGVALVGIQALSGQITTLDASLEELEDAFANFTSQFESASTSLASSSISLPDNVTNILKACDTSGTLGTSCTFSNLTADVATFKEIQAETIVGLDEKIDLALENKLADLNQRLDELANTRHATSSANDTSDTSGTFDTSQEASSSGQLAELSNTQDYLPSSALNPFFFESDAAFINDFLAVNGTASIVNAEITNLATIAGNLLIDHNSIGTTDTCDTSGTSCDTLYLQPLGGSLNLLAGLLTLDDSGLVQITGDLNVTGTVTANQVQTRSLTFNPSVPSDEFSDSVLPDLHPTSPVLGTSDASDLQITLATSSAFIIKQARTATSSGTSDTLDTSDTSYTASITGEGAAQFSALNLPTKSGTATIAKNTRLTTVTAEGLSQDSQIIVTFAGDFSPATRYWVVKHLQSDSFTIYLDQNTNKSIKAYWLIIN